jgi:hypothetical protein
MRIRQLQILSLVKQLYKYIPTVKRAAMSGDGFQISPACGVILAYYSMISDMKRFQFCRFGISKL